MATAINLVGPGGALPLDQTTVEALAEFFVGLLDLVEPDSDFEVEETDTGNAEDEVITCDALLRAANGPECLIADNDREGSF